MYSTKTCTSSPTNSGLLIGLLVAQSCPTLCDPMNCGSPGSSVHGDSPGKNTGVSCHFPSPGDLPDPRDRTQVSRIAGRHFTSKPPTQRMYLNNTS